MEPSKGQERNEISRQGASEALCPARSASWLSCFQLVEQILVVNKAKSGQILRRRVINQREE